MKIRPLPGQLAWRPLTRWGLTSFLHWESRHRRWFNTQSSLSSLHRDGAAVALHGVTWPEAQHLSRRSKTFGSFSGDGLTLGSYTSEISKSHRLLSSRLILILWPLTFSLVPGVFCHFMPDLQFTSLFPTRSSLSDPTLPWGLSPPLVFRAHKGKDYHVFEQQIHWRRNHKVGDLFQYIHHMCHVCLLLNTHSLTILHRRLWVVSYRSQKLSTSSQWGISMPPHPFFNQLWALFLLLLSTETLLWPPGSTASPRPATDIEQVPSSSRTSGSLLIAKNI